MMSENFVSSCHLTNPSELSEVLAEMKSCQMKLQEHEIEKTTLTLSLQKGEAEINRLQEFIR